MITYVYSHPITKLILCWVSNSSFITLCKNLVFKTFDRYLLYFLNFFFERFTVDALTAEVRQIKTSVTKLHKDLESCPDDVKNQLKTFIQVRHIIQPS